MILIYGFTILALNLAVLKLELLLVCRKLVNLITASIVSGIFRLIILMGQPKVNKLPILQSTFYTFCDIKSWWLSLFSILVWLFLLYVCCLLYRRVSLHHNMIKKYLIIFLIFYSCFIAMLLLTRFLPARSYIPVTSRTW